MKKINKIDQSMVKNQILFLFILFILVLSFFIGYQTKNILELTKIFQEERIVVILEEEEKEPEVKVPEEKIKEVQEKIEDTVDTIEPKIKEQETEKQEAICYMFYCPVIGKDGKAYDNDCLAKKAGTEVDEEATYKNYGYNINK